MPTDDEFLDARKHAPRPDDVMARFRAAADFVDGEDKRLVLDLLRTNPVGADMAVAVLRNRVGALALDAVRVALEMAEDLAAGVADADVLAKPYRFHMELLFYCKRASVPDNQHWDTIPIVRMTDRRNTDGGVDLTAAG